MRAGCRVTFTDTMRSMSIVALCLVVCGVLAHALVGSVLGSAAAALGLVVYLANEFMRLSPFVRRRSLVAWFATVVSAAWRPGGFEAAMEALLAAAYLAVQLAAVSLLVEAGQTSRTLQEVARGLISLPSGRRYLPTTLGAHLLSLVLSLPAITFLGGLVRRSEIGMRAGREHELREVMTAVMRGLTTMTLWSPLSFSFAVVLLSVPTVDALAAFQWAAAVSFSFLVLGCVVERLHGARVSRAAARASGASAPPVSVAHAAGATTKAGATQWLRVVALVVVVGLLLLAVITLVAVAHLRVPVATVLVVPVFGLFWLWLQYRRETREGALRRVGERVATRLPALLRGFRNEIALLSASVLFGRAVGTWMDASWLTAALGSAIVPPLAILVAMLLVTTALALVGISPMITIAVVGSALPDPGVVGITPLTLMVSFLCSWAVGTSLTPLGPTVMLTALASQRPAGTVAFRWNGSYAFGGFLLSLLWFVVIRQAAV
jgi:hypothetical protein